MNRKIRTLTLGILSALFLSGSASAAVSYTTITADASPMKVTDRVEEYDCAETAT